MATTRKNAASKRKPAARKSTPRKRTTTQPRPEAQDPILPREISEEERQAKLTAYTALKSAGLEIPAGLNKEVEGWIAEERKRREIEEAERAERQSAIDKENAKGPWYVRNGYQCEFNLRLDRQTEKRRIQLKPRGNPGDMHPLEEGDLTDPVLVRNVNERVIEIIPAGEARRIMDKQTRNMGPRVHTPEAIIQREYAEHAKAGMDVNPNPDIRVEISDAQKGITVATVNPAQMQGRVSDKDTKQTGGVERVQPGQKPEVSSEFIPTGDYPAQIQHIPHASYLGENVQAKVADDLARRRGLQGPGAGLGGLQVSVGPTQTED